MSILLIQEAGGGDMMIRLAAGLFRTRLLRAAMALRIIRQPRQLRRMASDFTIRRFHGPASLIDPKDTPVLKASCRGQGQGRPVFVRGESI
jgi:hypothetical protein